MIPFFYIDETLREGQETVLSEETSKHLSAVLRMKEGEELHLTNGKGYLYTALIQESHKKKTRVKIQSSNYTEKAGPSIIIAIGLIKNSSRFEWFLEKVTEIGIQSIIPLITARTEKQHLRIDRLKNILVSAMLQSQQVWIPEFSEPVSYNKLFQLPAITGCGQKLITHCEEEEKQDLIRMSSIPHQSRVILIGPEGDFNPEEIVLAKSNGFQPVTLGNTRLRTETAGIVAASLLKYSA